MLVTKSRTNTLLSAFILCLLLAGFVHAHDEELEVHGVRLQFIPPPLEGTISLGIYDQGGKLVRLLHRESDNSDFIASLNGLVASWDGKDDSGRLCPAGHYQASGYTIGDLRIEGESFHFNDWVTEENPMRVRRILDLRCSAEGALVIQAQLADSNPWLLCNSEGGLSAIDDPQSVKPPISMIFPEGETLVDHCPGADNCMWVIVRTQANCEVRQYSSSGEFQRRLAIRPEDPQPVKIAASPRSDQFYLLEEDASQQRLRGLALKTPSPAGQTAGSAWKTIFGKSILFSESLEAVKSRLSSPVEFLDSMPVALRTNPLLKEEAPKLTIKAGFDSKGSFLQSSDGLVLCTISENPALRWVAIARQKGSNILAFFQSDGTVVEEFSIKRPANMMAFDCGDFDFVPPK